MVIGGADGVAQHVTDALFGGESRVAHIKEARVPKSSKSVRDAANMPLSSYHNAMPDAWYSPSNLMCAYASSLLYHPA